MKINIQSTDLADVFLIRSNRFHDERGFFEETWNAKCLSDNSIDINFVQDNHSFSKKAGTLRGMHYQAPPHAQDKLIRCSHGAIFDVVVDIRKGSSTYGKWLGFKLSDKNGKQLLIPKGFLHGFITLEPNTEVDYKCSDFFFPELDNSVRWDSLGIKWPLINGFSPIISEKDNQAQSFANFLSPFNIEH